MARFNSENLSVNSSTSRSFEPSTSVSYPMQLLPASISDIFSNRPERGKSRTRVQLNRKLNHSCSRTKCTTIFLRMTEPGFTPPEDGLLTAALLQGLLINLTEGGKRTANAFRFTPVSAAVVSLNSELGQYSESPSGHSTLPNYSLFSNTSTVHDTTFKVLVDSLMQRQALCVHFPPATESLGIKKLS